MKAETNKTVLVIRAGALGDFVLTLPVLAALRTKYGGQITILGYPEIAALAVHSGLADAVARVDDARFAPLFADGDAVNDFLRRWLGQFDLAVAIWNGAANFLIPKLKAAGVAQAYAIEPAQVGNPINAGVHAAEYMWRQLPEFIRCASTDQPMPRVKFSVRETEAAAKYVRRILPDAKWILAIHPGSGGRGPNRNWPAERFAECCAIARERGWTPILVCGPADADFVRDVTKSCRPQHCEIPIIGDLNCVELAAALQQCAGCISNDSGVAHLAAAVGIPTVAIFGATDHVVWGPHGRRAAVVAAGGEIGAIAAETVFSELERVASGREDTETR